VIDAAGAIYVIGGRGGGTDYKDVWVSTDGGAQPDSVKGAWSGGSQSGYYKGTQRYYMGMLQGYYGGTTEVLRGTRGY
jgi:hypothetical protein